MHPSKRLSPLTCAIALAATFLFPHCKPPSQELQLSFAAPPIALGGIEADFAKDIAYDAFPETQFDIFIPRGGTPAPLVVHIHGGGFVGGAKADIYGHADGETMIRELLDNGIAFATINYRLLQDPETAGVRKPLNDARRCLQFIRYHAAGLKIDKTRIGLHGASAGAGTSLWLALNDDLADPANADPVLRESTRVKAAAASGPQASYDIEKWESVVFASYGLPLADIVAMAGGPRIFGFYGVASAAELATPATTAYRQEVDLLALLSPDDPPLWIESRNPAASAPADRNQLFHHYKHGEALLNQAQNAGVACMARFPAVSFQSADWEELIDFFKNRL